MAHLPILGALAEVVPLLAECPVSPPERLGSILKFLGENFAACNTTRTIMTVNGPRVQVIPDVSKTTKIFGGHGVFTVVNAAASKQRRY